MNQLNFLDSLIRSPLAWNSWRNQNPSIQISLRNSNLIGVNLAGANLDGVDLGGSDLTSVNLSGASPAPSKPLLHFSCSCYSAES